MLSWHTSARCAVETPPYPHRSAMAATIAFGAADWPNSAASTECGARTSPGAHLPCKRDGSVIAATARAALSGSLHRAGG